jgi:hypothetical protein
LVCKVNGTKGNTRLSLLYMIGVSYAYKIIVLPGWS